jgi:hypothetical protein
LNKLTLEENRRYKLFSQRQSGRLSQTDLEESLLDIVDDTGLNTSRTSSSIEEEELTCAICLDTFEHQSKVVALPCKAHIFHPECIEKWIKNNAVCPECRFEVTVQRLDEQKKEIKDS